MRPGLSLNMEIPESDMLMDPRKGHMTLLDPTAKLHARSRIPLDLTTKSIAGSMIPLDPATKTRTESRIPTDLATKGVTGSIIP